MLVPNTSDEAHTNELAPESTTISTAIHATTALPTNTATSGAMGSVRA